MSYTPSIVFYNVAHTLCIRYPAFNCIQMAWVAGLGAARAGVAAQRHTRREHRAAPPGRRLDRGVLRAPDLAP